MLTIEGRGFAIEQLHPYNAMILKNSGSPKCMRFVEMQQILQSAFCAGILPHQRAFDRMTNVCFMSMKGQPRFTTDYCHRESSNSTGQEQGDTILQLTVGVGGQGVTNGNS